MRYLIIMLFVLSFLIGLPAASDGGSAVNAPLDNNSAVEPESEKSEAANASIDSAAAIDTASEGIIPLNPPISTNAATFNQPGLVVQPSKFIEMLSSEIKDVEGSMRFEGTFVIRGQGVFGHFDVAAFNDSGKVIRLTKTDDRAYVKDKGARVKSITIDLGAADKCIKAEVSFHEMRLEPESGACHSKK